MKKQNRRSTVFVLLAGMILAFATWIALAVGAADPIEYVYFDLAAGSVTINNDGYSGKVYLYGTNTTKMISGQHTNDTHYYIYQSTAGTRATSGYNADTDEYVLPKHTEVKVGSRAWGDFITNNTDMDDVIATWDSAAGTTAGRTATSNRINISLVGYNGSTGTYFDSVNHENALCDITLDNVWSSYQDKDYGGLNILGLAEAKGQATLGFTDIVVNLKGDSRMHSVYYATGSTANSATGDDSTLTFNSYFGNGREEGSLTVIGIQEKKKNCGSYQGSGNNVYFNHWNSVIGGTDSNDHSMGMYFNGGTVYAASAPLDNCTAIGGGGNGTGEVTINGGRVTAVAYTTGTAIGGGIAHTGVGGIGIVQINGGKVYAYNYGQPAYQTVSNFGSANAEQKWAASHVAGTAIGGASSILQNGSKGTVTVTGGTVYAESLGGSGLGGGNSVSKAGGEAVINISGGSVTAKSTKQDYYAVVNGKDYHVAAGAAIGGGTGGIGGNGGNATINISQADPLVPTTVKTGSMGGGGTNNPSGKTGYASVTMSGGSLQGQIVMAKGGTKGCSFTMTGGTLSNTDFICL